jgi:hypothetical protein
MSLPFSTSSTLWLFIKPCLLYTTKNLYTMDIQQTFPFMRLPIELRLMVFECIPVQIKRHDFARKPNTSTNSQSYSIVSKSIDLSILRTCRKIHDEASAIMQGKLENILETPPRMIINLSHYISIHKCGGPLWHVSRYLVSRAVKAGKNLGSVPYLGTGMGASGAHYSPQSDPDHDRLAHLINMWFRSLEYQRNSSVTSEDALPSIDIALVASDTCPHMVTLHALRQLTRALFAEHGGFRFKMRKIDHMFPRRTDKMCHEEDWVIEHAFEGGGSNVIKATRGYDIDIKEFKEEWSQGDYYLSSTY